MSLCTNVNTDKSPVQMKCTLWNKKIYNLPFFYLNLKQLRKEFFDFSICKMIAEFHRNHYQR